MWTSIIEPLAVVRYGRIDFKVETANSSSFSVALQIGVSRNNLLP